MDEVLLLFAYPEHRRRHDEVNFLSTAKFKPFSWLNDQQASSNILPVTVKIAHGVNEFSTVLLQNHLQSVKSLFLKLFWQHLFTYHFQHLPVDAEVVTTLDTVVGDQT